MITLSYYIKAPIGFSFVLNVCSLFDDRKFY